MANTEKTVTVEQIGSPLRRPKDQRATLDRSRPEQDAPPFHTEGHS